MAVRAVGTCADSGRCFAPIPSMCGRDRRKRFARHAPFIHGQNHERRFARCPESASSSLNTRTAIAAYPRPSAFIPFQKMRLSARTPLKTFPRSCRWPSIRKWRQAPRPFSFSPGRASAMAAKWESFRDIPRAAPVPARPYIWTIAWKQRIRHECPGLHPGKTQGCRNA